MVIFYTCRIYHTNRYFLTRGAPHRSENIEPKGATATVG